VRRPAVVVMVICASTTPHGHAAEARGVGAVAEAARDGQPGGTPAGLDPDQDVGFGAAIAANSHPAAK
jgi:hypothetical protein